MMHAISGRRTRALSILVGLWFLLCLPGVAIADWATLSWDPNTEADLAGYKVHHGMLPAAYTDTIDVGHVTTHTVPDLVPGEMYYFAVTAYDIFANESNYSTEVSITIPEPAPAPEDTTTPTSEDQGTTAPTDLDEWYWWWWNMLFG